MFEKNPFTDHPSAVGETYSQHAAFAFRFGGTMVLGGLACMAHGLLPFLFVTTGSSTVKRLYERVTGRGSQPAAELTMQPQLGPKQ